MISFLKVSILVSDLRQCNFLWSLYIWLFLWDVIDTKLKLKFSFFCHLYLETTSYLSLDPDVQDQDLGREWPLTLSPRVVRDNFAIDVNTVMTTTSYIFFLYD